MVTSQKRRANQRARVRMARTLGRRVRRWYGRREESHRMEMPTKKESPKVVKYGE